MSNRKKHYVLKSKLKEGLLNHCIHSWETFPKWLFLELSLWTQPIFCLLLFFSRSEVFDSLWSHALQSSRLPCPSPCLKAYSNSCPLSRWCPPTILSSVVPFASCLQPFPASGSFPVSQFFTSGCQSIRVSASVSVLPMNIQGWLPLGLTGLISLQSKGLSRIFSNITVQKHQLRTLVRTLIISETFSSGSWDPILEGQTRGHFQECKCTFGVWETPLLTPAWCSQVPKRPQKEKLYFL